MSLWEENNFTHNQISLKEYDNQVKINKMKIHSCKNKEKK